MTTLGFAFGINALRVAIIDGYLDEPSCLGVPPYISPHIRYTYGALVKAGVPDDNITYHLIDQLRADWQEHLARLEDRDLVIIIAGTTVPGRYLRGRPVSPREISKIGAGLGHPTVFLGGPIVQTLDPKVAARWGLQPGQGALDAFTGEIAALTIYGALTGNNLDTNPEKERLAALIRDWAVAGARVTEKHPYFPHIVCELETFRGCPRPVNCAFCSERLKRLTYCRLPEDVVREVDALYRLGNRYFRLGCQTDLFAYGGTYVNGDLQPNQAYLKDLYEGIHQVAPGLRVLHMDNANPAVIANNPEAATEIIEIIARHNTAGDVAAFGLESADPAVLTANNINTDPDQVLTAIRIMNTVGGFRVDGIPKLLPGLNFLHGLKGEGPDTMAMNVDLLKRILDDGLMLRRINIRQVQEVDNYRGQPINERSFKEYKDQVNQDVNLPMLKRVFPTGTILRGVQMEKIEGNLTFGRQLGSYPILVGVPGKHKLGQFMDLRILDHGYRSLTGLPFPFNINGASLTELQALPGIGKKRAMRIFLAKPITGLRHLSEVLNNEVNADDLAHWVSFSQSH